jgi:hypothetical protein
MVENIDPVSGNPVPPGASPKEVRDDVPIMASEGEYVVPANVVRYLGLERLEKLVSKAKQELERLDQEGRIGGKTDDDLPFELDELVGEDEEAMPSPPMMAEGGMVTGWQDVFANSPQEGVDPITGLPLWLTQMQAPQAAPAAPTPTPAPTPVVPPQTPNSRFVADDKDDKPRRELTGTAQRVEKWSPDDFNSYVEQRNGFGQRVGQTIAQMSPLGMLGGQAFGAFQRNTDRRAVEAMTKMVETGKDLNGNPLSTAQLDQMKKNLQTVNAEPLRTNPGGVARGVLEGVGIVSPRNPERKGLIGRAIDAILGTKPVTPAATQTTPALVERRATSSGGSSKTGTSAASKSLTKIGSRSDGGGSSGGSKSGSGLKSTAGTTKSTSSKTKSSSSSSSSGRRDEAGASSANTKSSSSNRSSSGGKVGSPRGGR